VAKVAAPVAITLQLDSCAQVRLQPSGQVLAGSKAYLLPLYYSSGGDARHLAAKNARIRVAASKPTTYPHGCICKSRIPTCYTTNVGQRFSAKCVRTLSNSLRKFAKGSSEAARAPAPQARASEPPPAHGSAAMQPHAPRSPSPCQFSLDIFFTPTP
jgi:hypothetical protein